MFIEISKEEFSKKVEDRVSVKNCSYIDAVIYILEENSLDVSLSSKFLTKPIIEKLQEEGQKMNILSKKNKTSPFA